MEDGRRVPPTSSNGSTDTNLIPQMLVERVDVVTGGASAAYGSDAVSGAVNFILDKKFTGLKADIQRGISTYKYICKCWTTQPDRFTPNPHHQMPEPNT